MRVYVGGTFDLFHAGHVQFLMRASQFGLVTVALNTDEFVKQFKKRSPVMTYAEREEVVRACRYVFDVVPNISGADSKPTIERVNPDYIIVGDDWKDKGYCSQMSFTPKWLTQKHIKLVYIPYTKNISSTIIKNRIKNG